MLGALAVGGHLLGQLRAQGLEGLQERRVILALFGDDRVARHAVCQHDAGVVGGGVAVHADAVEADVDSLQQSSADHLGRNGAVGGQEAEHGAHVGVDHAAALGDAAHADSLAAHGGLHGHLLFHGVSGHDGVGRRVAGLRGSRQRTVQLRHAVLDDLHVEGLADDAGGGHQHVLGLAADGLGRRRAHLLGVLLAVGGAGVGVAAVGDDGPGLSVRQVDLVHMDGRGLHHVFRKHGGRGALHIGDDQGHILLPGGVGLDAHMDAGGLEALGGADAAFHKFQHSSYLVFTGLSR